MNRSLFAAATLAICLSTTPVFANGQAFESTCQTEGRTVVMALNTTAHTATATFMIPGFVHHPLTSPFVYRSGEGTVIIDRSGTWFIADPESGKTSFLSAFGGVEAMTCSKFHEVN